MVSVLWKVIQMRQLHTPKASRNPDTGHESFIRTGSGGSARPSARGRVDRALTRSSATLGTFTNVLSTNPRTSPTSPVALLTFPRVAAALIAAALLVPSLVPATPAYADGVSHGQNRPDPNRPDQAQEAPAKNQPEQPAPPAKMSTVGGERLGIQGTQVQPKAGAPELPAGLTARSWIVADADSGKVLASHNAHWRLPPASTLKMLFADTVLPKFPKEQTHKVAPSDLAGMGTGSSLVGIKENQSYTVHDLWLGVFLRSGNDAVHTLSAMNGGTAKTVKEMQEHARELNAVDTHVVTPDGYDAPGQVSSAYDLTLFARSGLQNADFREYCSTATAKFPGVEKDGKRETFEIQNTNRLMTGAYGMTPYKGIAGVKNGSTTNAGATFTGVAERDGRKLLVTVMNPVKKEPNEAYKETAKLFDWGFAAADKVEPVGRLVGPRSEEGDATVEKQREDRAARSAIAPSDEGDDSGEGWTALGITGGALVVLGALALAVRRRWPLPDLVRRRSRR